MLLASAAVGFQGPVLRSLRGAGLQVEGHLATDLAGLTQALVEQTYDAVIARLPPSLADGLAILRQVQSLEGRAPPVVFVASGVIGEREMEVLAQGAADLVEADRMSRLPIAVRRELLTTTRRRQLEAQVHRLRAARDGWRGLVGSLVEGSTRPTLLVDRDRRAVAVSAPLCRLFGLAPDTAPGVRLDELLGRVPPGLVKELGRAIEEGTAWPGADVELEGAAGEPPRPVRVSARPVSAPRGYLLLVTFEDLASRSELDTRRLRTQRLESVGRLAASLAHDLQNILAALGIHAELLSDLLKDEPDAAEDVEGLREALYQARTICSTVLALGTGDERPPRAVGLNERIRRAEPTLRRLLGGHVELRTALLEPLPHVMLGPGEPDQILVNLTVNARDAMPSGGTLEVRTELEGGDVLLVLTDDGVGMSAAVRDRAFEPFFTTKGPGGGSGLGLATVQRIVARAGGSIELESAPGVGTRCRIRLPSVRG
ncbi:MAG: nitrogen regulation protein NR(II) [Sandaracinaceae bacterium]